MTSLRHKMESDLKIRNLADRTARQYLCCIRVFARHFGRSPDLLGADAVRAFLLHLREQKRSPGTLTVYHAALRFFYCETLGRSEVMETVPRPRSKRPPLGVPLTHAEVQALLDSAKGDPRAYTIIATFLATGLRLSELRALQVGDIDAAAGLIAVRSGKGDKPRIVQLGERHLRLLRRYWVVLRPPGPWVFPAQRMLRPCQVDLDHRWADHPIAATTVQQLLRQQAAAAGLRRKVRPHDLRRTYGTWLMEAGEEVRMIQELLGHGSPGTTARYTRVHPDLIRRVPSPLDML